MHYEIVSKRLLQRRPSRIRKRRCKFKKCRYLSTRCRLCKFKKRRLTKMADLRNETGAVNKRSMPVVDNTKDCLNFRGKRLVEVNEPKFDNNAVTLKYARNKYLGLKVANDLYE